MGPAAFPTNQHVVEAARANLSAQLWDKLIGGTESETTLRRNRLAFDSLALVPRIQSEDAAIDARTTFLGHGLRIPVMTAPIGSLHVFATDGALAAVRAVAGFGSVAFVSSACPEGFERIGGEVEGTKILQLAIRGDLEWCIELVDRALAAGYCAVCVTVDTVRLGRQERQIVNNGRGQTREHPFRVNLSWADVVRIRDRARIPLMIKGISTADDAAIALDHGIGAICVSNHGGHGLDHGRSTIDALSEVVDAVGDRVEVIVDGGVMRGTDVLKAVARGARATLVGKLQGIGLAAGGESGLARVLEILEHEIVTAMAMLGVCRLSDVGPLHVMADRAVAPPTELSCFPGVMGPDE
jgi:glycolate oxidase